MSSSIRQATAPGRSRLGRRRPPFGRRPHDPSPTTRARRSRPADAAGNVSSCSVESYVEDSTAPASRRARPEPRLPANNNSPLISGSADDGVTVKLYTTATAPAPSSERDGRQLQRAGIAISVADDSSTTSTPPRRTRPATSAAARSPTCTSRTRPPASPTARVTSCSARQQQCPEDHRQRGRRLDGQALHDERLLGLYRGEWHRRRAAPRSPGRGGRRFDHELQGDGDTTLPATSAAARAHLSTSRTRRHRRSLLRSIPDPVGPANDNTPLISGNAEAGSTVELYTTGDCSGAVAASAPTRRHSARLASRSPSPTTRRRPSRRPQPMRPAISAAARRARSPTSRTRTLRVCPRVSARRPASPANDNAPMITGTAQAGSTVKLYATSDCSGAVVASDTAAAFASPGLAVFVSDDSTTTYSAVRPTGPTPRAARRRSPPSIEDSTAPAQPNGLGSTPAPPANDNAPKITGSADAGSTVKLYTTNDCSGSVEASGAAAACARQVSRSRWPTTRPPPSRQRRPTRPATSAPARAATSTSRTRRRRLSRPASARTPPPRPMTERTRR